MFLLLFRFVFFFFLLLWKPHQVFATLGNLSVTEVRLEAEEDMCKYNRLVRYYEGLGFRQLQGSKVHYVHHCDQVYRKVRAERFGQVGIGVSSVSSSFSKRPKQHHPPT